MIDIDIDIGIDHPRQPSYHGTRPHVTITDINRQQTIGIDDHTGNTHRYHR
jgi:hypothetical protein